MVILQLKESRPKGAGNPPFSPFSHEVIPRLMGTGTLENEQCNFRNRLSHQRPFSADTTRHINVEGGSGVGKSTLPINLFIEHIRQGHGGLFIDPHGDTADQIARLIPKSRTRDFIWIDSDATQVPPSIRFTFEIRRSLSVIVDPLCQPSRR